VYDATIPTESERVASWRLETALKLDVPLELAEEFAAGDADLHRLAELVDAGCRPEVAARIVI
jgi:hypothetical protein